MSCYMSKNLDFRSLKIFIALSSATKYPLEKYIDIPKLMALVLRAFKKRPHEQDEQEKRRRDKRRKKTNAHNHVTPVLT